ncbi:MAG: alpha-D-glucose phosphate-specific phosphoglucomutase [Rhodobacteraceae bacterium]|nr:alpha-D-glucose phosphate-specific phosphoglucomutase [Paracoccaceae bacterium]
MASQSVTNPTPVVEIATKPFDDQSPGTSGLRKKVERFAIPTYVENYVQAIFDSVPELDGGTLVLGGDGRFFVEEVVQTILRMAAANGVAKILVGQNGLLSTPAASHMIRLKGATAGIILSASHNPGGPKGDFGIKLNMGNGGAASESVTARIFERSKALSVYRTIEAEAIDLSALGTTTLLNTVIEVVDPVSDYADLMEQQFDFELIREKVSQGLSLRFDAMHAVTGPYALEIFENRLGFAKGSVVNAVPLPDFGGGHPDPNPSHAVALMEEMYGPSAPDFGAASDGDGDRNLIVGRNAYVAPSDSLAVLAANATLVPAFKDGLTGVARSMPTSSAADKVAEALGFGCYVAPTGWKFFCNLLDADMVGICGEESAGTGGNHVREKDGLWAVLFWLNILAVTGKSVDEIMQEHWKRFGRVYYARHDFEGVESEVANALMSDLTARLPALEGSRTAGVGVRSAKVFDYHDPTDGSVSANQGISIEFVSGARLVVRLSGTGTSGATVRVYLEQSETDPDRLDLDPAEALIPMVAAYEELLDPETSIGLSAPTGYA